MKKLLSMIMAILTCSCFFVPANAMENRADEIINKNVLVAEIPMELEAAEAIFEEPCQLQAEDIQEVGDFIVVNRFYETGESIERANVHTAGAMSAVTWYRRGSSSWTYKMQLAAWFEYDGSRATCTDTDVTAVDASYNNVAGDSATIFKHGDIASARTGINIPKDNLHATLEVSCTKDGELDYTSENKYF